MLLREKIFVTALGATCALGLLDIYTPIVNTFWEKSIGSTGRYIIFQGDKIGYVNNRGRLIIRPSFEDGLNYFNQDVSPVLRNGKWGFILNDGRWFIGPRFYSAREFYEDLAAVAVSPHKFGFVNRLNEIVIPGIYSEVGNFSQGLAAAKSAGLWGYIDKQGKWIISPQFDDAQNFSEGMAAVKKDKTWGFIGRSGVYLIKPQFSDIKNFQQDRALVKQNLLWGYINSKGEWIVEPKFSRARSFVDGLAAVDDEGYINLQGQTVIQSAQFYSLRDFSEGLAAVQVRTKGKTQTGKWGFINTKGEWVIDPRFELAKDFDGGMARVSKDKDNRVRGYIHKNGKLIWDPADWEKSAIFNKLLRTVMWIFGFVLLNYVRILFKLRQKRFYAHQTIG